MAEVTIIQKRTAKFSRSHYKAETGRLCLEFWKNMSSQPGWINRRDQCGGWPSILEKER